MLQLMTADCWSLLVVVFIVGHRWSSGACFRLAFIENISLILKNVSFSLKIKGWHSRIIVIIENRTQASPRRSGMLWGEFWGAQEELGESCRELYI